MRTNKPKPLLSLTACDTDRLAALEVSLTRRFWVALSCNFLTLPIYFEDLVLPPFIAIPIVLGSVYGLMAYLRRLSRLAILTDRNWITWAVATGATGPIGTIVSYLRMRKILAAEVFACPPNFRRRP
jgi:hypothetical protein